jgi:hypothetical protein
VKGFDSTMTWLQYVEDLRGRQDRWQGKHLGSYHRNAGKRKVRPGLVQQRQDWRKEIARKDV